MAQEGRTYATTIKDTLEAISGWTGRVYIYTPPIKSETDVADYLTRSTEGDDTLDAWFVNRTGLATQKYGEARRAVHTRERVVTHEYRIRGFQSQRSKDADGNSITSELLFQDLCDQIEAAISIKSTMGVTSRTVYGGGFQADIIYQTFGSILCHSLDARFIVHEHKATSYE